MLFRSLDAGTRVGRYLLQDVLGHFSKSLGDFSNVGSNVLASLLVVIGWGYFLIQGVRDPLGGINSLWPLFGIANQLLASIALCLCTTVILKIHLAPKTDLSPKKQRPAFALITFIPLVWLLSVTMTAGYQKIFDPSPKIGFLASVKKLDAEFPALKDTAALTNRVLRFNNYLDAIVVGAFLVLVAMVFILSLREWILLLARKRPAELKETPPAWLPDYAVTEGRPTHFAGYATLAFALCKELSGEAEIDRAKAPECACTIRQEQPDKGKIYVEVTESRYKSIRRCC